MSIEKWFALYFPSKPLRYCTVRSAKGISLVTGVILMAYIAQCLFLQNMSTSNEYFEFCILPNEYYVKLFDIVELILYSFAPFTLMITANSAAIYKLVKANRRQQNKATESTCQAVSKSATKGTAMLITVSLSFLILTALAAVIFPLNLRRFPMLTAILHLLGHTSHCINGVLYCIIGSRFRREMITMLHCCCQGLYRIIRELFTITELTNYELSGIHTLNLLHLFL